MTALTGDQKYQFWRDGVLVVEDAVTLEELENLRKVFVHWVEESRGHDDDYGETLDGRARFDLEPGHTAEAPALRRVQSPEEISDVYADVMRNARTVDVVAELIGPAIRFHHGKVNSKLPGAATKVKFHQDFLFQPMTNDDLITALFLSMMCHWKTARLRSCPVRTRGRFIPFGTMVCLQVPWPMRLSKNTMTISSNALARRVLCA